MKRLFDIIFSSLALIVFAVPCTVITLLLVLKEKHPVFFYQERIGLNKKPFRIIKFQSMIWDQPTTTGKFIRKMGLDEVPQFINVLKGDMSIVGPRAITQADIDRLSWGDTYHEQRWSINPGITGYAQLYGGQHRKTSWFWDYKYFKNNNVVLDFCIINCSFMTNIFGKTRVRRILFNNKHLK
jgi:lipopolysaccharide/colanic/teichoic acid biosynthesis glycosyltransferase